MTTCARRPSSVAGRAAVTGSFGAAVAAASRGTRLSSARRPTRTPRSRPTRACVRLRPVVPGPVVARPVVPGPVVAVQSFPVQSLPVQSLPVQSLPVHWLAYQVASVQSLPVQSLPAKAVPVAVASPSSCCRTHVGGARTGAPAATPRAPLAQHDETGAARVQGPQRSRRGTRLRRTGDVGRGRGEDVGQTVADGVRVVERDRARRGREGVLDLVGRPRRLRLPQQRHRTGEDRRGHRGAAPPPVGAVEVGPTPSSVEPRRAANEVRAGRDDVGLREPRTAAAAEPGHAVVVGAGVSRSSTAPTVSTSGSSAGLVIVQG